MPFRFAALVFVPLFLAVPAFADASEDLAELAAEYHAWTLANRPILASRLGDRDAARRLPDVTPEAQAERLDNVEAFLGRLDAIDADALTDGERATHGLLRHQLDDFARGEAFDELRAPFLNDAGFHIVLDFIARDTPIRSVSDAEALIARYHDLPRYFDQHLINMRRGVETGWTQPEVVVGRVIETLRAMQVDDAADHPLARPFARLPAIIPDAEQERLRADALAAIKDSVAPAYTEMLAFLETEYVPRPALAASSLPNGQDWYRALAKYHTTLDTSPDDIHAIGQAEVARIRDEMKAIIEEVEFEGSFAEFLAFLRSDDQFYAETPEELVNAASRIAKRADARMPDLFGYLPRLSYGVEPVPAAIAAGYTAGRYIHGNPKRGVSGTYLVNTYNLRARPLYELPALTLHEAVPGHHHQVAITQELEDAAEFRRHIYLNVFGEGWGLYSEHLGYEMGIYRTPYERFGALSYEMWRACRLVVDTGLHWLGWTREQAEACFLENSALSQGNITTEVDRYIAWPGQALAYKIGEMKIKELRARAEEALGEDFDVRAFHDVVLKDGSVTLTMLEAKVDRWIAEQ